MLYEAGCLEPHDTASYHRVAPEQLVVVVSNDNLGLLSDLRVGTVTTREERLRMILDLAFEVAPEDNRTSWVLGFLQGFHFAGRLSFSEMLNISAVVIDMDRQATVGSSCELQGSWAPNVAAVDPCVDYRGQESFGLVVAKG